MTTTTMDGPRGEFNFIFIRQNHNEGIYSFRKCFIRLMFAFNLIELLIDCLTASPFFAAKTFYEELDINNVCVLNIKGRFIFFDRQNHNIKGGIDAFV